MDKNKKKEIKVCCDKFDSISTLIKVINSREVNQVFKNADKQSSETGSESFTGTKNYNEAVNLLTNGWDKHLKDIKNGIGKANVNSYRSATRTRTDVVGYSPCVPRAIQGLPDSMYNSIRTPKKVSTVKIIYEIGVSASTEIDDIIKAGITLLSMVNILESKGVKVELNLACTTVKDGKYKDEANEICSMIVCVKRFRDNLDLKKLLFPLVHPSMIRRIFFKYVETNPELTNSQFANGYGYPYSEFLPSQMKAYKEKIIGNNTNEYLLTFKSVDKRDPMEVLKRYGMIK